MSSNDYARLFRQTDAEMTAEAQRIVDGTRAQAAAFIESANTTVQRAMDRRGLSTEARQAVAARTYRTAQAHTQQLLNQHIAGIEKHRQTLIDRAFGARGGDAQTAMARRQAQQMVTSLEQDWQATDMLKTAQQDGDTQLAQVIAGHAYSRGWFNVIDQWNANGTNDRAVASLREVEQLPDTSDVAWRMATAGDYYVQRPAVLDGLREQDIDRLANHDLGDAA